MCKNRHVLENTHPVHGGDWPWQLLVGHAHHHLLLLLSDPIPETHLHVISWKSSPAPSFASKTVFSLNLDFICDHCGLFQSFYFIFLFL
jgi:hypothetical protein